MDSLLITPQSPEDLRKIQEFLVTLNVPAKVLSEEDKEDLGLLLMLSEVDYSDTVSEEEIRKTLRGE